MTKSDEQMAGEALPKTHYDQAYKAISFRINSSTKEALHSIRAELGKSWNQTFLHLIRLHNKKHRQQQPNNFTFKKRR